jgi:hypothetical protein
MATKKLYELLAVDGQLKTQAQTTRGDLRATFEKKRHLFEEKRKTFTSTQEGVEAASIVEEQSDIQTTVPSELQWIASIWSKAIDTSYQVAEGNTIARADVILDDGTTMLENVPATALLELEKRAAELMELLRAVPTLDPAKGFTLDTNRGRDIYKARDVTKTRTHKNQKSLVLIQPTVEHPGQAQMITVDEVIGQITEQEWSSLITPSAKGDMIARAEEVLRAFKAARQRANAVELQNVRTCAAHIFNYVLPAAPVAAH